MKHFIIVLTGILAAFCATAQSRGVLTTDLISESPGNNPLISDWIIFYLYRGRYAQIPKRI